MLKKLAIVSTAVIAALVGGAGPAGAAHEDTQQCRGLLVADAAGAPVDRGREDTSGCFVS